MEKIKALYFKFLPNSVHSSFFNYVNKEIHQSGSIIISALGPLIEELDDYLAKERSCNRWIRKSQFTNLIVEANSKLNHSFVGLSEYIRVSCYSDNPAIVLAARNLYQVLKRYGRVIKQNYVSKKVNIKTILDHLEGDMNLEVKALKAEGWMASVASAWKEFNDLIRQREFQSNDKPSDNFRQIRPKIEAIWHLIAQILNSGAVISQSPEYITLIDKLNPMIVSLNHTYHRIRYSIADAEMISIKPLCYTGQAHTPVPEVLYMMPQGEISQLQLGKDFNVIYKDNINPGNATCTIQGKGRYKGSRSVTFFIEG